MEPSWSPASDRIFISGGNANGSTDFRSLASVKRTASDHSGQGRNTAPHVVSGWETICVVAEETPPQKTGSERFDDSFEAGSKVI
jgi:hypothetical protein